MGQILHGSATTTEAVRRAIQRSQESLRALATHYGINQKTVAKWKRRTSVTDLPTGPKEPRSTVLSLEDEAIIVAFRKHTLLPLDDCLYALQASIPHLTRSSLHRCLQRHGIGRLPQIEEDKPTKKAFKAYPIGYFHIDIAEVQTAEGKLYLFVAIDQTSKFTFVQLVEQANRVTASAFLVTLIEAVPYRIHTVLTDNGIQFRLPPRYANGPTAAYVTHMFDMRCRENGIEHRFTKINHPWTNGQVERMNRTIKEATVRRYHYDSHDQLRRHLGDFVDAYNFGRRLKTSRSHALRIHVQNLGVRTRTIHPQPAPPNAGTKQFSGNHHMPKFAIGLLIASLAAGTASAQATQGANTYGGYGTQGQHQVQGYTNQNGSYVQPHVQTYPNNTTTDNWSTRGNTNPYTGQPGRVTPRN